MEEQASTRVFWNFKFSMTPVEVFWVMTPSKVVVGIIFIEITMECCKQ